MGYNTALDLSESIGTLCNLDQALLIHLRSNHFPPLPYCLLDTCKQVIDACKSEDYDQEIELPDGITWKGNTTAPAYACANEWHLQAFIQENDPSDE